MKINKSFKNLNIARKQIQSAKKYIQLVIESEDAAQAASVSVDDLQDIVSAINSLSALLEGIILTSSKKNEGVLFKRKTNKNSKCDFVKGEEVSPHHNSLIKIQERVASGYSYIINIKSYRVYSVSDVEKTHIRCREIIRYSNLGFKYKSKVESLDLSTIKDYRFVDETNAINLMEVIQSNQNKVTEIRRKLEKSNLSYEKNDQVSEINSERKNTSSVSVSQSDKQVGGLNKSESDICKSATGSLDKSVANSVRFFDTDFQAVLVNNVPKVISSDGTVYNVSLDHNLKSIFN